MKPFLFALVALSLSAHAQFFQPIPGNALPGQPQVQVQPQAQSQQGQPALLLLPHLQTPNAGNVAPQIVIGNVAHTLSPNSVNQQVMSTIGMIFGNQNIPTYLSNNNKRFFSVRVTGQCLARVQVNVAGNIAYKDQVTPLNGQCPANARLQITNIVAAQPNEIESIGAAAVVSDERVVGKDSAEARVPAAAAAGAVAQ